MLFSVAHSSRLISIDLSDNYLVGNTIAGMLGELIRVNAVLVRLILRKTRLGVVALCAITSALTENHGSLEVLDLSENEKLSLSYEPIKAFCASQISNPIFRQDDVRLFHPIRVSFPLRVHPFEIDLYFETRHMTGS